MICNLACSVWTRLSPNAGLSSQTRRLRPPATAPSTGRGQGRGGPLRRRVGDRSTGRPRSNRSNRRAAGPGTAGKLLVGRRAPGGGCGRAARLLANGAIKDGLAAGGVRLRARRAVGPRTDLVGEHLPSFGAGDRRGVRVARDIAAELVCQGGGTAEAGRPAVRGDPGPHDAILINVAARVSEGALLVESAALAGNQVPGLLLRHVLRGGVSDIGDNSYTRVIVSLGPRSRQ